MLNNHQQDGTGVPNVLMGFNKVQKLAKARTPSQFECCFSPHIFEEHEFHMFDDMFSNPLPISEYFA